MHLMEMENTFNGDEKCILWRWKIHLMEMRNVFYGDGNTFNGDINLG